MEQRIIKAKDANAAGSAEGLTLAFIHGKEDREIITLDPEVSQRFVIGLLRRAYFANPENARRSSPVPKDLLPVPCKLKITGSPEGVWILQAQIGDLIVPLQVEQEAMIRLAEETGRIREGMRARQGQD